MYLILSFDLLQVIFITARKKLIAGGRGKHGEDPFPLYLKFTLPTIKSNIKSSEFKMCRQHEVYQLRKCLKSKTKSCVLFVVENTAY